MSKRYTDLIIGLFLSFILILSGCSKNSNIPDKIPLADISLDEIPAYSGESYVKINGNYPFFTTEDYSTVSFELYSDLDSLGRCGTAYANIGKDIMPTEERGEIGMIKPSGWQTVRYDIVEGGYLYNRCHLIGYQLSGENDNELNLITGTRYLNTVGMLPFENRVADYVESTDNHVLYRVTPMYDGNNLVATGVLMEAMSMEDNGEGIRFNVFCYNIQPGIEIDYATGKSRIAAENKTEDSVEQTEQQSDNAPAQAEVTYIGNKNSHKFHYPYCDSVSEMKEKNKVCFYGTREEVMEQGYAPCAICRP